MLREISSIWSLRSGCIERCFPLRVKSPTSYSDFVRTKTPWRDDGPSAPKGTCILWYIYTRFLDLIYRDFLLFPLFLCNGCFKRVDKRLNVAITKEKRVVRGVQGTDKRILSRYCNNNCGYNWILLAERITLNEMSRAIITNRNFQVKGMVLSILVTYVRISTYV